MMSNNLAEGGWRSMNEAEGAFKRHMIAVDMVSVGDFGKANYELALQIGNLREREREKI